MADELFHPARDPKRTKRALAPLGIDHHSCEIERPLPSDAPTKASFRLRCSEGPVDLSFSVDEATGRITDLRGAPPADDAGICA